MCVCVCVFHASLLKGVDYYLSVLQNSHTMELKQYYGTTHTLPQHTYCLSSLACVVNEYVSPSLSVFSQVLHYISIIVIIAISFLY